MRLTAVLSFALALAACSVARGGEEAAAPPVVLTADTVELDLVQNSADATGRATLVYGSVTLHADHITASQTSGEVRAAGGLTLTQEGRVLTGEALDYNIRTQQGALTQARVQEQGVIVQGERIEFSPQRLVAHNALFTTCNLPRPDYALAAEEITLTATTIGPKGQPTGGRVSFRHARVVFHGRTLLRLPSYSTTIGQVQQRTVSLLPVVGYSHLDGPFLSFAHSLGQPSKGVAADMELRLTTLRGVRGWVDVHQPVGPGAAYVRYSHREDLGESDTGTDEITLALARVLVDRKPEVGLRLGGYRVSPSLRLWAQLATGHYAEHQISGPETVSASRTSVLALVATDPHAISHRVSLSHALGLRFSTYSAGDNLSVLYLRQSVGYAVGPDNSLSLSYTHRASTGDTPFRFDEVGIADELRSDLRYRLNPRWSFRVVDIYDLREDSTRDMLVSVTRTEHCLDYTIGWKKLRNSFFIGISLVPNPQAAPAP